MLFGRTALFFLIQASVVIGFWATGSAQDSATGLPGDPATYWQAAAAWWPYTVTLGNGLCLLVLLWLYRRENQSYWDLFRIRRASLGQDLLIVLGVLVFIGPLGYFPNVWLAQLLFGSPEAALTLFIQPLPVWAAFGAILIFPVLHGLVELPLYFAYAMPRLTVPSKAPYTSPGQHARPFPDLRPVFLPGVMLALQHIAMPFIPNWNFLLWRGFMFLPFALAVGVVLHWRPRLLPYLVVIHILMDLSLPLMLLPLAY